MELAEESVNGHGVVVLTLTYFLLLQRLDGLSFFLEIMLDALIFVFVFIPYFHVFDFYLSSSIVFKVAYYNLSIYHLCSRCESCEFSGQGLTKVVGWMSRKRLMFYGQIFNYDLDVAGISLVKYFHVQYW